MGLQKAIKVLVAEDERYVSMKIASYLENQGFTCKTVNSGSKARATLLEWKPDFALVDLILPESSGFELLKFMKDQKLATKTIIMSGHNDLSNIREAFRFGANDYIIKPIDGPNLLERLLFLCRKHRMLKEVSEKEILKLNEVGLIPHLTSLVLKQALSNQNPDVILHNLTKMLALKTEGVRCSIIQFEDQNTGYVVTSSDSLSATGIKLNLARYPEVLHVVHTGHTLAVEDIGADKSMASIKSLFKEINFNSIIVCPVFRDNASFGVLSLRMPPGRHSFTDEEIRFVEITSQIISLCLSTEKFKENNEFWRQAS